MKLTICTILSTLLFAAAFCGLKAEEPKKLTPTPEFEKLKTLVGTWHGQTDMGNGPVDMDIHFRLLAGGSVLEERVFEGTPNEMVTMFYDKGGKVALTHYCMMGNRPEMALKSSAGNTLTFDFDSCCGIDATKESHMHAMTLRFDDADTLTSGCKALIDGKELPDHLVTLKRVKTESAAK